MLAVRDTANFKVKEFACPCCGENKTTQELIDKLQEIRNLFGFPMKVNSGYRCKKHNAEVKGVADSVHMSGNAVDISITDGNKRYQFLAVCYRLGIKRIGLHKQFIHVDIAMDRPLNQVWFY